MPLDAIISLELGPDYVAKRGLKYGCGPPPQPPPPPLPRDPVMSMVLGHDLKSGKTVGVMLPWIFWNVNSKIVGKLNY